MTDRIKTGVGVMILKGGKILLGHRTDAAKDTGGIFEPGSWCLPGGKQEYKESIFECAKREVKEETGLVISDMMILGAADDIQPDRHFVTIWVLAQKCSGQAAVMEPEKQDDWQWFSLDSLPENLYSPSEKFISFYISTR